MLHVEGSVSRIEGHAKDLCVELTHLLSSFRDTMVKEYGLPEEDVNTAMVECFRVATMNAFERRNYLDELLLQYRRDHE